MSGIFDGFPSEDLKRVLAKLADWREKGPLILEVNKNLRPVPFVPAWILRERARRGTL